MTGQRTVERRAALDAENTDPATFANPTLQCDIVMKGGITSGVVYPGAVLRLARRYRFRSIGGTSAGAIAAAVVAAAEHARDKQGFTKIAELPKELAGTAPDGRPFMLQLFQADRETRPLFDTLIGFMRHDTPRALVEGALRFPKGPLTGLAVAGGSIALSAFADVDPAFAVAGVALAVPIGLTVLVGDVKRAVQKISDNHFGLCRLGPGEHGETRPDALTPWLHEKIQTVAGRPDGPPLTFADLWGVPQATTDDPLADEARRQELLRRSRKADQRELDLQMVTTDLTHGRPIRLPVPFQPHKDLLEEEAGRLLFDPGEMRRFFPDDVVDHLERFSAPLKKSRADVARLQPAGTNLKRFPIGPDLPIVVATRMSLSFPFLISAIPLFRIEYPPNEGEPRLDRVVFSDGGVTSNFPIHFFDSPLPRRPTFGLNLTTFDRDEQPDLDDPAQAVQGPLDPNRRAHETVREIDGLGSFAGALKNAAQNWRDNAQSALPGYRDRIAHIKLAGTEGGLNLVMPPDTILRMNDRGDRAGVELMKLFAGPEGKEPTPHWNDHRFTRFRVAMGLMERWLQSFARSYAPLDDDPPLDDVTTPYAERVALGREGLYPYGSDELLEAAKAAGDAYVKLVREAERSLDDEGVPRPPSTLRAVPPV